MSINYWIWLCGILNIIPSINHGNNNLGYIQEILCVFDFSPIFLTFNSTLLICTRNHSIPGFNNVLNISMAVSLSNIHVEHEIVHQILIYAGPLPCFIYLAVIKVNCLRISYMFIHRSSLDIYAPTFQDLVYG